MYLEKMRDINHLRQWIIAAVESVTAELLAKTYEELVNCLDVCRGNVAHIKVYITLKTIF